MNNNDNEPVLPFLTSDLPGIGGQIKTRPEDFVVDELPLYQPSGQGTHLYIHIEKAELSTMDAIASIARALGLARKDVGYAGMKDARAVARQWLSVEHVKPELIQALDLPRIKILEIARHGNKLRIGHMSGNRFVIRLRNLSLPLDDARQVAHKALEILSSRGVPNYFGPQRFGNRRDSHILGLLIAKGLSEEFIDQFLGRPLDSEQPVFIDARKAYESGDYESAIKLWPYNFADQRRAIKTLIDTSGNKRKAANVVDKHLKKFFISAFQSDLFNRVLAARMPNIDSLLTGDMAYKHVNGAMFKVEDAAVEQPRCTAFEISPTGPLIGKDMKPLDGPAADIENPILASAALNDRDLQQIDNYARGGRRPLRFGPKNSSIDSGSDDLGPFLQLAFDLDSGSYATTLLREITKTEIS